MSSEGSAKEGEPHLRKDVVKLLLIGHHSEHDLFLQSVQKEGLLEFISLSHEKKACSERAKECARALKLIKRFSDTCRRLKKEAPTIPTKSRIYKELSDADGEEIARHIIESDGKILSLEEEEKIIRDELQRVEAFGAFNKEDIDYIQSNSGLHIEFFCRRKQSHDEPLDILIEEVGQNRDYIFYVAVGEKPCTAKGLIPIHIEKTAPELKQRQSAIIQELAQLHTKMHVLVRHQNKIHKTLASFLNQDDYAFAKSSATPELDERLFASEVWIDERRLDELKALADQYGLYWEKLQILESDKVPTLLENKGAGKIGEDLIEVYDVPSAKDKDPSLWVLVAFALFFAIIVADAGYGLVLLIISLFLKLRFKAVSAKVKRFFKLMMILSSTTLVWGVLSASFFGMSFAPNSPVQRVSVIHWFCLKKAKYHMRVKDDVYAEWVRKCPALSEVKSPEKALEVCKRTLPSGEKRYEMQEEFSQNALMELALLIGLFHIILSLLRGARTAPSSIGWVLFLIGGYLYFPSLINVTTIVYTLFGLSIAFSAQVGLWLLCGGIGLACGIALIQEKLKGLAEITKALQIFADVLSYLRLYALALAGMILASTFNGLGAQVGGVFGALITLAGHGVNFVMALMAAVIHGLRLNFLEFYHYCFEGEGKLFSPLRVRK